VSWPKGVPHPVEPYRGRRQPVDDGTWVGLFLEKVQREPDGCWTWLGTLSGSGRSRALAYGYVRRHGRMQPAHRAYWEVLHGPVPDGLELDHLCRNRHCVNPDHLEPVTRLENIARGELGARWRQVRSARTGRA
jgi:HNH endonuclease